MLQDINGVTASSLTPTHGEFLRRVVGDEAFRNKLQKDPAATLASVGISIDVDELPNTVHLPESIKLQQLEDDLEWAPVIPVWGLYLSTPAN